MTENRTAAAAAWAAAGVSTCMLAAVLSANPPAQEAPPQEMRAREIFLLPQVRPQQTSARSPTPAPPPSNRQGTPAAPPPAGQPVAIASIAPAPSLPQLAFRYSLHRRIDDTQSEEVDADTRFSVGDAIKIRVKLNDSPYLYIGQEGRNGAWVSLFPSPGENNNFLGGYTDVSIPRRADEWMVFDASPEVEHVYVAASRGPIRDLQRILAASRQNTPPPAPNAAPAFVRVAANFSPVSRGLVVQKVDTAGVEAEHAVYVAAGSATENEAIAHFVLQRR